MNSQTAKPRCLFAAALLLTLSLALAMLFYGSGANLLVLALAVAALLSSLVCVGSARVANLIERDPRACALSLAMLGYLILAYRLTSSPDNSFAASWVLAAGPIAFICGSALAPQTVASRLLAVSLAALVIALAMNSSLRFVLFAERAHLPLPDPNNYAALMYLVWIPLVHWHLARGWRNDSLRRAQHVALFASSFVLILAIIATRSRTSTLIVCVAFVVWLLIGLLRRRSCKFLLAHVGVAVLASIVAACAAAVSDASPKGVEFAVGISVRHELIRAALAMFAQHPLGIGVFCFPLLYPSFRSALEQDTAGLFVHNDYVQFLVEGGVPLLLLLLLFVVFVLRRIFTLVRLDPSDPRFAELGLGFALAAACAHAFVNFVFYSLPLGILSGLLASALFAQPIGQQRIGVDRAIRLPNGAVRVGIVMAWVIWLYLALDVATVGVFQGQPTFGLVKSIRADEQRMLEFARIAQRINGERGIPALGEAILLHRAARAEPESNYLPEQAYRQFHRAISADPWNSLTYVRFAQFLDDFPLAGGRPSGESDEELLLAALAPNPLFVPALDQLLAYYAATSEESKRYALLRGSIYPWMPTLRRNDPDASDRYFDLLEGYASANGDENFLAELKSQRAALVNFAPRPGAPWFL